MRIDIEQYEQGWKKSKFIKSIVTDNWQTIIPDKTGDNNPRILILMTKRGKETRYDIDRIRYVHDELSNELYMVLIVSKSETRIP